MRKYRSLFSNNDLCFFTVSFKETDLALLAERNLASKTVLAVKEARYQIENYIRKFPAFKTSLKPLKIENNPGELISKMAKASRKAGVGPMASVAGVIAEFVGSKLLEFSSQAIVENGGDLFIKTSRTRKVGIYAGNSPFSGKLALRIPPSEIPISISTSSGTMGSSGSFGAADSVTVLSEDAALSDAVATAACNRVKTPADVQKSVDFARGIDGVLGVLVILEEKLGIWGKVELSSATKLFS